MAEHTKSPWFIVTKGNTVKSLSVEGDDGANVCSGISPKTGNAALIAAAPDLLEACEGIWQRFEEEGTGLPSALRKKLRAAIAKAQGGAASKPQ